MQAVLEIHLAVGFLVVLCALIFSWNALGTRVMNAVVGLQFLIGIVLAALLGAAVRSLGGAFMLHAAFAVIAVGAYGMSMGLRRKRGAKPALVASVIGFAAAIAAFAVGLHLGGRI